MGFQSALRLNGDVLYAKLATLLVLVLPIVYVVSPSAADGIAVVLGLLFLTHSFYTKDWAWLREPWVVAALLLCAYITLRALFAEEPMNALRRAAPYMRFPLFAAALGFWLLRLPDMRAVFTKILAAVLIFILVDTFMQYALGMELLGRSTYPAHGGGIRLTGPFDAPKVGIILVWLGFPVLIGWLLPPPDADARHTLRFVLRGAALLISFMAVVFLTGERMAFLLTIFGLGVAAMLRPSILRRVWLPALVGGVAVLIFCVGNPQLVTRQFQSTYASMQQIGSTPYGMIWTSAMRIVHDYPAFGVGARHFREICPQPRYGNTEEATLALRCNLHPHHFYLEWLVEQGFVGLSLMCVLIVALMRVGVQAYRMTPHDAVLIGILAGLVIRIWPLSTAVSGFVGWAAVPMWLLVGWMVSYAMGAKAADDVPTRNNN